MNMKRIQTSSEQKNASRKRQPVDFAALSQGCTRDSCKRPRLMPPSASNQPATTKDALIHQYLHKMGHETFRSKQLEIIKDVVDGKNVFLNMSTGSGKSLCFQIATLVRNVLHDGDNLRKPAIGIVISPLISLMTDQVNKLSKKGIAAALWNSTLTKFEKNQFKFNIQIGKISIVYTTPESLLSRTNGIKDLLLEFRTVSTFCIDEMHCIIMWGSSFRPSYFNLAASLESFGNPPLIACSATVPPIMRRDILRNLKITHNVEEYVLDSNRPNLELNVQRLNTENEVFLTALHIIIVMHRKYDLRNNSVIVFCGMIKTARSFHDFLNGALSETLGHLGITVGIYHSKLNKDVRKSTLNEFINGTTSIMVGTSGFGMGIDKPNVRCVIHLAMPPNPEEWTQQIGRAGRDGLQSHAYLLTHSEDKFALFCIERNCESEVKKVMKYLFKNYQVNSYRRIGTTGDVYRGMNGMTAIGARSADELSWDELFDYKKYKNAMDILQRYGIIHKAGNSVYLMSKEVSHIDWNEVGEIDDKNMKSYKEMVQILNSSDCIRERLQRYFGEKFDKLKQGTFPCCSSCKRKTLEKEGKNTKPIVLMNRFQDPNRSNAQIIRDIEDHAFMGNDLDLFY